MTGFVNGGNAEAIIVTSETMFALQYLRVTGEPLIFNLSTNIATPKYLFVPESMAIFMRGQRLTHGVDFEIIGNSIHSLDQVSAFDTFHIDYLKSS